MIKIPASAVTMHPKGTPAPTSSVEVQVFEERVDLSNDMTGRQMIAVGVRRVILARGELDKLGGARICREQGRVTPRGESKGSACSGVVAERGRVERSDRGRSDKRENDESGKTARWHEGCSEKRRETAKRDRKRQTPKGGRRLAHHTPLLKIPVGGGVPSSHPSLGLSVFFFPFLERTRCRS